MKLSARNPSRVIRKLAVIFSMSRSLPLFNPVIAEMLDIFEPRSNPANLTLKIPALPLVTRLVVGPAIVRFSLTVPLSMEAPFGR